LGLDTFIVPKSGNIYPIIIGGLAFVFLWFGNQKILETGLTILIALMSLAFVYTAFNAFIDWESIVSGLFIPTIPDGSLLTILALLGTTIVPYNLFLHASLAKTKWKGPNDLAQMKRDTMLSILIGGAISMSIVIAASAVQGEPIRSAIDLANGLEPTFGSLAQSFVSIGLFAAGLTSAITAPLAAAYVLSGIWGKSTDRKSSFFRSTWMIILGIGILFSTIGFKPILLIQFAQVANGLVLPFIALFLIWVSSQKSILGTYINHRWMNITGIVAMVFVIVIGLKGIWGVIA
jgi:Mn2+/Fe2+ NRAMP family transporter